MSVRRSGLALLLAVGLSAGAPAQAQDESERKSCDEYRRVDGELNRAYQIVLEKYKADALFVEKLRAAQRAWLAFRDAQVEARFPARDPRRAYGSAYGMCRCEELTELTRQRTDQLLDWSRGREAGDVCAGSIQIRDYTGRLRPAAKPKRSRGRTPRRVSLQATPPAGRRARA